MFRVCIPHLTRLLAPGLLAGLGLGAAVHAQSSCSSDAQARPVALLERFINADCRDCWSDATTPRARRGEVALDWVVPGSRGEDAPLSAVANPGGLHRLKVLGLTPPARSSSQTSRLTPQGRLRVAHGLPVSGYIGASIELRGMAHKGLTPPSPPLSAWLTLVETIPAGTENSPVPRTLVRNQLGPLWNPESQLSKVEQSAWREARSMDIPPGTDPTRLAVIGRVEDGSGRVLAAAQSRCRPGR